ncbi:DUF1493 family protein [Salmonella enterica subsp. enterica]|nr:DUF1493 family protein [Salmonella enterica subsp. enterica serovar Miami]
MLCHFVDGIIFTLSNTNDSYRDNFIFDAVHQSVSCTTQLNFVLPLKHLLNPFRKNDIPQVPEFTIGMLIASARSGRWLYD